MILRGLRLALPLVVLLSIAAFAAEGQKKPCFTDPATAGPDFLVQGEYRGEVDGSTYGVQVIALGNGQFRAVAFKGGLPGAGADDSKSLTFEGSTQDGVTKLASENRDIILRVQDNALLVQNDNRETLGELPKVHRESPTLGAKPPQGAIVLFDGTSADAFEKTEMTEDHLLSVGGVSKKTFQSFTLHLEFRTPFEPESRGQGRGNSGVYLQGRYEVQVLDSFGLPGADNECGSIYHIAVAKPVMSLPPLTWQTYDIDFTAAKFDAQGKQTAPARVTVKLNGVVIHDNLELPTVTPGGIFKEVSPEPGPLFLQNHRNPVRYRNIWVVEKN